MALNQLCPAVLFDYDRLSNGMVHLYKLPYGTGYIFTKY